MNKTKKDFLRRFKRFFILDEGLPEWLMKCRENQLKKRLDPKFRELVGLLDRFAGEYNFKACYPLYYSEKEFHWVDLYIPNKLAVIVSSEWEVIRRVAGVKGHKEYNLKDYNVLELIDWDSPMEMLEKIAKKLDE